jgi:hypothetical protein
VEGFNSGVKGLMLKREESMSKLERKVRAENSGLKDSVLDRSVPNFTQK